MSTAQTESQPSPPFPPQGLEKPGLEAKMDPQPRFEAPQYRGAGKLRGQAALVTGGDSGIGRAVAVLFAREGANVAITYLLEEEEDAHSCLLELFCLLCWSCRHLPAKLL